MTDKTDAKPIKPTPIDPTGPIPMPADEPAAVPNGGIPMPADEPAK
jgi:hypothetical protein